MKVCNADGTEKCKCTRFDLNDREVMFRLFKKDSTWKCKRRFQKDEETLEFYKPLKSFKSKSELDLWCSLTNVEYEMANEVLIVKDRQHDCDDACCGSSI